MKTQFKPLVVTAALSVSALAALAQPAPGGPGPDGDRRARMHERMEAHMEQRAADLKAKLKLKPEQENAWTAYVSAMKPPAGDTWPNHDDFAKLSTPQRLDKMRELRKQRDAEFDKRDDATRTFYSGLGADQKKIFDDETARPFAREGRPGAGR